MKKFLKITGISLLVILLLLIVAPFLFKGKIVALIKEEANKNLNATLNFNDDISISLIRNFPQLSIGIDHLSITGKDTFSGDTLVYLPEFKATLNLMSVIKGDKIEINTISLEKPLINLLVLENGKANWDIAKADSTATEDTSASKFNLALDELTITDGNLLYTDNSLPFNTSLKHFDHTLTGDFTADNFLLKTVTSAKEFTLGYGGINYIYKVAADIKANLDMDMKNMKFTFSDNDILLNQLNIGGEGFVDMNDADMDFDLKFRTKKTDFKNILSLVPGMYAKSFDKAKASGKLDFSGYMKGKMTDELMPGFGLKLNVDNGFFQYPDLPKSLNKVYVNLAVDNPSGIMNNTVIDLSRFDATIAGEPVSARLLVKNPMTDPYLDGALKGNVNLSEFRSFIPLDAATEISGLIKSDVSFKGTVSGMSSGNIDKINALGTIVAQNFHYKDPENLKQGTTLNSEIAFNPQTVELKSLAGNVGMSDFNANGSINNLFGYLMKDELLKGQFVFNSTYFNANEFLTEEPVKKEPVASDSIPLQAFEVPANIDFSLSSGIKTLIYDNLKLTDLAGTILLKDQKMLFQKVGVNLLGGSMALNGEYDASNPKFPFSNIDFNIKSLDIIQSFNYFESIQKFMPIAKYTEGLFNADIKLANNFNNDLSVAYPTVTGTLQMGIAEAALKNMPILTALAEKLKIDKFKNLSLKNLNFKLNIVNGKVGLDSLILPLWQGAKAKISGFTALDQSLQYVAKLSIPRSDFGPANTALDNLTAQAKQKGLNLAVSDLIDVDVVIGGFFNKPDVKVSLHDAKKHLIDNLKDQVKDQIDAKKQALVDDGKRRAEEAKQKAMDSLNRIKQNAIDKLNAEKQAQEQRLAEEKRKAEEQARAEAEKAKAEAEKKAKEKLKGGIDGLLKKKED
ncbi:MAG: AsmA family protein [Bacteroidota bacterium]